MAPFKNVVTTQADWQQGTLDGVMATAAGDLELAVEFSDDFDRSTLGPDWEIAPNTQGSVQFQNGELVLTGGSSRRMWVRTTRTFEAHSIVFRARRDSADAGSDVGLAFNWDGNLQPSGAGEPLNGYRLFWRAWEDQSPLRISRYDNGEQTILASIELPPDYNEHEFAVLIEDGVIRVFVDGVQMLQMNDSTYTSGYVGLTAREDSTDANRRGRYNWIAVNREPLGSRVSPILDLSTVGTAAGSSVSWAATTPAGTSVTVETRLSLDGGQTWGPWQVCTNGGTIPDVAPGMDLSNAQLQTRVTLSTTNTTVTPRLHDLTLSIGSRVTALSPTSVEVGISRQTLFPLDIEIQVSWDRQIHASLYVGRPDGVTWTDVSDYLASVTVELGDISGVGTGQSGVDGVVRRASFVLRNDRAGMPGDSFSPRDRQSAWNQFDVDGDGIPEYAPLLWPNREVVLQVAVTLPGAEPGPFDWVTIFHGFLGDSIRTSGPTVECDARDLAKRLQDTYILTPRTYGSEAGTPAEDVIQQIIDDNLGPGEVTLYFPSGTASDPRPIAESPGFMVTPYRVEYMSVWDAIQQVTAQFGWFLGYRWHPNTGRMQLILMEPPRNKDASTADFHFTWEDDIYTQDLEITDRDIRNIVTVTFRNSATGDRESVTVKDDTSIATYGPRAMQIEEGDASLIDTREEAERLANAALADLKDLTATTQLQMPLLPTLDVFSGIVVTDPRLSSTDDFFGVEQVRHTLDFEARQFRTEAVAAGRVIGGHHRWLQMQTRPGKKDMPYTTADRIVTGTFELTPDKQIATPDDQVRMGPDGIEMQIPEQGGTRWSPSGLVFTRADGTESGYVRAAVAGIAQDGDYVPLNFTNEPVVVLSPARAIVYDPSVNVLQKLRLEAVDVSPEGFRVVAKLMQHGGPGRRTVFPNTNKWHWYSAAGAYYCTDGGHVDEPSARMWSEHRLRDVGDKKTFTTGPNATGVVVRIREMLHAHANAGNIRAQNTITYRLRIRQVGSPTWLATLGPFTRSIRSVSPLLRTHLEWRHVQVAHMFSNLAPAQYEVEIEITGKSIAEQWGKNRADACYLLIEEIEEMQEEEIATPEPITVHYVAFESDSPGGEEDD